ncbi:MAG: SDR family NAD(P)-dependent oxidoreductase [Chromatiales bacterium]|nr:SDR family NAD(P)-dependent oxidoreductase [Chromatiales bacterium]
MPDQAGSTELRAALVTGAASGFGRALALALARDGWQVWACDLDEAGAQATAAAIHAAGGAAEARALDVREPGQWQALAAELSYQPAALSLLINNAGVAASGRLGELPLDEWRRVMDVNYWGAVHGCEALLPLLRRAPASAHIVNVASFLGFVNGPRMGAYSVSKAALIALSENLYSDFAHEGLGITVLCPGFFESGMFANTQFTRPAEQHRHARKLRMNAMAVDRLVSETLAAIGSRRLYLVTPFAPSRLAWWFKRLAPAAFLRRVARHENARLDI